MGSPQNPQDLATKQQQQHQMFKKQRTKENTWKLSSLSYPFVEDIYIYKDISLFVPGRGGMTRSLKTLTIEKVLT